MLICHSLSFLWFRIERCYMFIVQYKMSIPFQWNNRNKNNTFSSSEYDSLKKLFETWLCIGKWLRTMKYTLLVYKRCTIMHKHMLAASTVERFCTECRWNTEASRFAHAQRFSVCYSIFRHFAIQIFNSCLPIVATVYKYEGIRIFISVVS